MCRPQERGLLQIYEREERTWMPPVCRERADRHSNADYIDEFRRLSARCIARCKEKPRCICTASVWLRNDKPSKRIVRKVDKVEGGKNEDSDVRTAADDRRFGGKKVWAPYTANRTLTKQTNARTLRFFPQKHVRGGSVGQGGHSPSWQGREQTWWPHCSGLLQILPQE